MMLNKQRSLLLLGSSLILGVVTDTLVRQDIFGLNFLIWTLLWTAILSAGLLRSSKFNFRTFLYALFALANATIVYVRAEPIVQVWSVLSSLTFIALLFSTSYLENFLGLSLIKRTLEYVEGAIMSFMKTLGSISKSLRGQIEDRPRRSVATPGVVVGTLLVVVFIGLFSSSDQIFRKNFTWLGDALESVGEWINNFNVGRIISVLFFAFMALGWLSMLISRHRAPDTGDVKLLKVLSQKDAQVILGAVCVVFAAFVFVQLRYLFGDATLPDGMTYANYARSGYGQLLAATVLASGVVYITKNSTKSGERKDHRRLPALLLLLNGAVVLSAWKRLSLYESAYGWTMTRFVARMGIICIMAGIIYLLIWLAGKLANKQLFSVSWYTLAVVLLASAVINPAGLITKRNIIDLPSREAALDIEYLSSQSPDSYKALCKYSSTLREDYPNEYLELRKARNFDDSNSNRTVAQIRYLDYLEDRNRGLSAHYTKSQTFVDKYSNNNCLVD